MLAQLVEHDARVHGVVLDEPVAGIDVVPHALFEASRVGQVADADAAPRNLVFVGRPDPA